jgi:hypothetical protein
MVIITPTLNPLKPSLIHNIAIAAPRFAQDMNPIPIIIAAGTGIAVRGNATKYRKIYNHAIVAGHREMKRILF